MSKAIFTGWSCPAGPAELVDFLVDPDHAEEVLYGDFVEAVDVSTAPLDETQFEVLATDWSVTWLRTRLPSGPEAWVMQHSGIEHCSSREGSTSRRRRASRRSRNRSSNGRRR